MLISSIIYDSMKFIDSYIDIHILRKSNISNYWTILNFWIHLQHYLNCLLHFVEALHESWQSAAQCCRQLLPSQSYHEIHGTTWMTSFDSSLLLPAFDKQKQTKHVTPQDLPTDLRLRESKKTQAHDISACNRYACNTYPPIYIYIHVWYQCISRRWMDWVMRKHRGKKHRRHRTPLVGWLQLQMLSLSLRRCSPQPQLRPGRWWPGTRSRSSRSSRFRQPPERSSSHDVQNFTSFHHFKRRRCDWFQCTFLHETNLASATSKKNVLPTWLCVPAGMPHGKYGKNIFWI